MQLERREGTIVRNKAELGKDGECEQGAKVCDTRADGQACETKPMDRAWPFVVCPQGHLKKRLAASLRTRATVRNKANGSIPLCETKPMQGTRRGRDALDTNALWRRYEQGRACETKPIRWWARRR